MSLGFNAAPLEDLIDQFAKLPGIGRKGATRMAYQILKMEHAQAMEFAKAIEKLHASVKRCSVCQNFTDKEVCHICSDERRDRSVICVVENPRDISSFEKTREFHGVYHVLHGLISPMDGIGVEQLCIKELTSRVGDGSVEELIMATNPTVEGEATALYLARLFKPLGVKVTRLAYGLPVGAHLEYADEVTLAKALGGRGEI